MASLPGPSGSSGGGGNHSNNFLLNLGYGHPSLQSYQIDPSISVYLDGRIQTLTLDWKCSVCLDYPRKEIYQCFNLGHLVCNNCIVRSRLCRKCGATYGDPKVRNLFAENFLDMMTYNCSFWIYGCQTTLIPRNQRTAHEIQCEFNPTPRGVKFCALFGATCQFRICPNAIRQDVQYAMEVIRHLTSPPHKLHWLPVKIGGNKGLRYSLPTRPDHPQFNPAMLFMVTSPMSPYKIIGFYVLIIRVEMAQLENLSCAVVGFDSAPGNLNGGNGRKLNVKFSFKAKNDPNNGAKCGNACASDLSWTTQATDLNEWKDFMMTPIDRRPPFSFLIPINFLKDYYVQQDGKCEMVLSFGPLVN